jgi:hypothetical protein
MIGYYTEEQEKARKEQLKGYYTDEKEPEQNTISPMKLYPDLELVPASLVRRPHIVLWCFFYIIVLGFITSLLLDIPDIIYECKDFFGDLFYKFEDFDLIAGIVVVSVLDIVWSICFFKKILCLSKDAKGGYKKLVKEADYVSGNRGLCVFLKDMKFGVIKLWSCRVVIPPTYNYMEWETYGKVLRVKKDGRAFLIDIYGNEV